VATGAATSTPFCELLRGIESRGDTILLTEVARSMWCRPWCPREATQSCGTRGAIRAEHFSYPGHRTCPWELAPLELPLTAASDARRWRGYEGASTISEKGDPLNMVTHDGLTAKRSWN
jgi:hypothetical protein